MTSCTECCWINILATLHNSSGFFLGQTIQRKILPPVVLFSVECWVLGQTERDRGSCGTTGGSQDCLRGGRLCVWVTDISQEVMSQSSPPEIRNVALSGNRVFANVVSAGETTLGCVALAQCNWCACKWGMGSTTHHVRRKFPWRGMCLLGSGVFQRHLSPARE